MDTSPLRTQCEEFGAVDRNQDSFHLSPTTLWFYGPAHSRPATHRSFGGEPSSGGQRSGEYYGAACATACRLYTRGCCSLGPVATRSLARSRRFQPAPGGSAWSNSAAPQCVATQGRSPAYRDGERRELNATSPLVGNSNHASFDDVLVFR